MAEQMTFIDADGVRFPLMNQPDVDTMYDRKNFYMPPVEYVEEVVPIDPTCQDNELASDSKIVRKLNITERELMLRLKIKGNNLAELRQNVRKYIQAFSPLKGEGKLEVITEDGITRFIKCRYLDGMQGEETADTSGKTFQFFSLVLICYDPYFYSDVTYNVILTKGTPATFLKSPFFPMTLTYSGSYSDTTVNNNGEAVTYPTFTIQGSGSNIRLSNLTTGANFTINQTLNDSDQLTIDMLNKTAMVNGVSVISSVTPGSVWWGLNRGDNAIRAEISSTSSTTNISLTYQTKHLSI